MTKIKHLTKVIAIACWFVAFLPLAFVPTLCSQEINSNPPGYHQAYLAETGRNVEPAA